MCLAFEPIGLLQRGSVEGRDSSLRGLLCGRVLWGQCGASPRAHAAAEDGRAGRPCTVPGRHDGVAWRCCTVVVHGDVTSSLKSIGPSPLTLLLRLILPRAVPAGVPHGHGGRARFVDYMGLLLRAARGRLPSLES